MREPLRATLFFPASERRFTYSRYRAFLERFAVRGIRTVTLSELAAAPRDRPLVALRHDVDDRLGSALELGRLEHEHGIRSTYFVLHTAPYYRDRARVVRILRRLQDEWGHEIGFHNDLVTLQCLDGVDPVEYLKGELAWLRAHGLRIGGVAAHGNPWCHRLGYHNSYVFEESPPVEGFPHRTVVPAPAGACTIRTVRLGDAGLDYDAYALPYDRYYSDSAFDGRGRRWHPDRLDLDAVGSAERVVVLVHPCHWDSGTLAKTGRLALRVGRRLRRAGFSATRPSRAPRTAPPR